MAITTDIATKQEISPRTAFMENAKLFMVLEVFYVFFYVFNLLVRLNRIKLAKIKASENQVKCLFYSNIALVIVQLLNVFAGNG